MRGTISLVAEAMSSVYGKSTTQTTQAVTAFTRTPSAPNPRSGERGYDPLDLLQ
jgi:hypothetical protein